MANIITRRGRYTYETDNPDPWPDAVAIPALGSAVAWHVLGWQTEPDEDTEWTGYEIRTGRLVCRMVGDDALYLCDPEDVQKLARADYCGECGQIGCGHDGLDRDEAEDEDEEGAGA
jgi:hypothetical protein